MAAPYWTRHAVACIPGCEGDWECGGCQCHPEDHAWGCSTRCQDEACGCCCHQPDLFEEDEE